MSDPIKTGTSVSKNYEIDYQIRSLDDLWIVLTTHRSIFWRHGIFPSAFVISLQFRYLVNLMNSGVLYTIKQKQK